MKEEKLRLLIGLIGAGLLWNIDSPTKCVVKICDIVETKGNLKRIDECKYLEFEVV